METGGVAIQQALLQQNLALAAVKSNARAEQALARLVDQAAHSVPAGHRGHNLNILA